jgi:3-mercaptopyruvate sulfurtransferase SseA
MPGLSIFAPEWEELAARSANRGVISFRTSATLEKMKRIAVFCGSNKGACATYAEAAEYLGRHASRRSPKKNCVRLRRAASLG